MNAELGTRNFVGYDANGNVATLVNATNGAVTANYEYGPFGELVRANGLMAEANPFRFSTKYQDDESDLLYYGYRFYNPTFGRWLSRDPIGEVAHLVRTMRGKDAGQIIALLGISWEARYLLTQHPHYKKALGAAIARRARLAPHLHSLSHEPEYCASANDPLNGFFGLLNG